jgi:DinB superfamily
MLDFTPVDNGETTLLTLSGSLSVDDLRRATTDSLDFIRNIIAQASDDMITFLPHDPEADDPHAPPEMQNVGWTLGHLVAHVTASSEEHAAVSSILARGIAYTPKPRLRYETDWTQLDTRAKTLQRLDESRRMRLAYLDAWPDVPHLTILREQNERLQEIFGDLNAPATFLAGLKHEQGHHAQFREVLRQAQAARETQAGV